MSRTEIRLRPVNRLRAVLVAFAALVALYLYLGYLPLIYWILGGMIAFYFLVGAFRKPTTDPVIILNEKGLFDRRLKVGVIQWDDIRRIKSYSISGAEFIFLELRNLNTYQSRRPLWLRLLAQGQRAIGTSPIAIATNNLDVDHDTLFHKIHEGCGGSAPTARTVEIE